MIDVPVVLGLPEPVASAFPDSARDAARREVDAVADDLGLPVRAEVTVANGPFTVEIGGRPCPRAASTLAAAYRAAAGWAEVPDTDEVRASGAGARWLENALRDGVQEGSDWFGHWLRAVVGARPESLLTASVTEAVTEAFPAGDLPVAFRPDWLPVVCREVIGRRTRFRATEVSENLGEAGAAELATPEEAAEWLVNRLRPGEITVGVAPDVAGAVLAEIAARENAVEDVRDEFGWAYGVPAPGVVLAVDDTVAPGSFAATINVVRTAPVPVVPEGLVVYRGDLVGPGGRCVVNPFVQQSVYLTDEDEESTPDWGAGGRLLHRIRCWLAESAPVLVDLWTTDSLLTQLRGLHPTLTDAVPMWTECGPARSGLTRLTHQLLREGVPARDQTAVLRYVVDRWAGCVDRNEDLVTAVRSALWRDTTAVALDLADVVPVAVLPAGSSVREALAVVRAAAVRWEVQQHFAGPVVVCPDRVDGLGRALQEEFPTVVVVCLPDVPEADRPRIAGALAAHDGSVRG